MQSLWSETYLFQSGATLNAASTRRVRCTLFRPCKRVSTCRACEVRRRDYFITVGADYARRHGLCWFVTISWPLQEGEEPWSKLWTCLRHLSLSKTLRLGKFIRVIGVGEFDTPHIHLLVDEAAAAKLYALAHRLGPAETRVHSKPVEGEEDLLGYFYDRNFLVVLRRRDRPRGIRILSGSRGMSYGFPKGRWWRRREDFDA